MTTDPKVGEFFIHSGEVPEAIKDDLPVLEHAHDSTKSGELIGAEAFDCMPVEIVETFSGETDTFEVGFQGSLVLNCLTPDVTS